VTAFRLEVHLVAAVTALACALPGAFLVLRRLALLSDAIGHAVLLGIVLAFLYTRSLASPLLLAGAALSGLLTVSLVELLHRTGRVREDAAIGLVFPALFSLAVLLIARHARGGTHLDTDAVLLGEILLSPDRRLYAGGFDLGPASLVVMGTILFLNVAFIAALYKELKLATFDAGLAAALGFSPALLHYGLMTLVSVTAVGAFEAVGSILVVALMIAPPATALLLTDRLSRVLLYSAAVAIAGAAGGVELGFFFNASVAGSITTVLGLLFTAALVLAPGRGLTAQVVRRARQRADFRRTMLVVHLAQHEGRPEADEESRLDRLPAHLRWTAAQVGRVVRGARRRGLVTTAGGRLALTDAGRERAQQALAGTGFAG
jgi:manganese/zinc/iron transport system permease protein